MLRVLVILLAVWLVASGLGCGRVSHGGWQAVGHGSQNAIPNPVSVPMVSRELVMDEVADEVDDYFRILREQQIRLTENILTEGWIDTEPKVGSTCLEPWRKDSTRGFELAHASLQTVRRWARVRVIPNGDQYLVDVKVYKELEDLAEPEHSTVSGQAYRYDNALDFDRYDRDEVQESPPNKGWIPMGRDFSLEQRLLGNIQKRIGQAANRGAPH